MRCCLLFIGCSLQISIRYFYVVQHAICIVVGTLFSFYCYLLYFLLFLLMFFFLNLRLISFMDIYFD